MSILFLGDLHIGARNSNPVLFKMMKSFFSDFLFPYIKKNNIKTVIQLGDIHDKRKSVDFVVAEYIINTFFKWFEENEVEFISLVGNHDSYYKNTIKLDGMSQLTTKNDYITIIKEPTVKEIEGSKFLFVPWICDENQKECLDAIKKYNKKKENIILLGHFELSGFEITSGIITETGNVLLDDLKNYKKVISGHYHLTSEKKNIIYIGTPYELTWNDCNDRKRIILYDTNTNEFQMVYPNIVLYEKILYTDKIKKKDLSIYSGKYVKVIVNEEYNLTKLNKFLKDLNTVHPLSIQFIDNRKIEQKEQVYTEDELDNPANIVIDDIKDYYKDDKEMYDLALNMFETMYKEAIDNDSV